MRWIVLYNPANNKKGSPAWRVEPLKEIIETNLKALMNDEDFSNRYVIGGVFSSHYEAGQYLDELKYRITNSF